MGGLLTTKLFSILLGSVHVLSGPLIQASHITFSSHHVNLVCVHTPVSRTHLPPVRSSV